MKKILFYTHSLNKGGAEKVMLTVADRLNSMDGYDVVIMTDTVDELEYDNVNGIRRININDECPDGSTIDRMRALRRNVRREKPDIIAAFMIPCAKRIVFATLGLKCVIYSAIRSDPYFDHGNGIKRLILTGCAKRSAKVVCQTKYQAEYFPKKVRKKCVVISNPIYEEFVHKANELKDRSGAISTEKRKKITATGRLFDYKNHKLMIRAFKSIADKYPDTEVIIYGEGPYREELEEEIQNLELTERVKLPGDSKQVAEDIYDSVMYVLPSDTEGLPNALMEAMALGLPVIATDCPCGGPRSLIENGVNGILTPVGDIQAMTDAMDRLLSDEELRKNIGRNAAKILETNAIDKIVGEWTEIL